MFSFLEFIYDSNGNRKQKSLKSVVKSLKSAHRVRMVYDKCESK